MGSCCAAFLLPCRTESCLKKCREDEYWMTQCIQLLGPCTPPLQAKSHFIHSVASGFRRGNQAKSINPQDKTTLSLSRSSVWRAGSSRRIPDAIGSSGLTAGISRDPRGVDSPHTMISLSTLYDSTQSSADLEDLRRDIPEVCFVAGSFP